MYVMVCTWLNIAFSVGLVFQYLSNPRLAHLSFVQRILRYLKNTSNLGIIYKGGFPYTSWSNKIQGYLDVDWVGDVDSRRSTFDYVFLLNAWTINWASKRQTIVVLFTT